jgi:predicted XRE-type DNA-binding protein
MNRIKEGILRMGWQLVKQWEEIKSNLQSLSQSEKEELEITARLVAEVVKRRMDLGLSQRDIAEIAGIKQSAIARFERLGAIPRMDTFLRMLKPLGLSINLVVLDG